MDFEEPKTPLWSDAALLTLIAGILLLLHFIVGNGYGFHRDELQFLDGARHLSWGYVAYPPVTPFFGRVAISMFGISTAAFRLPAMLAGMINLVLTGLTARELGGKKSAQVLALFAAMGSQVILSSLMIYLVWDFLAWSLCCYSLARLLRTRDQKWWIAIGASIGFGVLCKYSIVFLAVSILFGVVVLPVNRKYLFTGCFYLGGALGLLIALPNLIWEANHGWVSLKMLSFIHARDVRLGRDAGFLVDQLKYTMIAFPLAVAGWISLVRSRQFGLLALFYLGPFVLFFFSKGRGYYLLPGYTPLYAAGAVALERALAHRSRMFRYTVEATAIGICLIGVFVISLMMLPIASKGSTLFAYQMRTNKDMRDETGWPQLVEQVAQVRNTLPAEDRTHLAILAHNYGEAGALMLYGPRYGLPEPISTVNSFYYRGFGSTGAQTVIAIGENLDEMRKSFRSCAVAAVLQTEHHQKSFDAEDGPILICHDIRPSWPAWWVAHQRFG